MKNQKLISGVLAMSMAVSACSSSSSNPSAGQPGSVQEEISKIGVAQERWVQLTSTDHPNYALAELLTPWLWSLNRSELTAIKGQSTIFEEDQETKDSLQLKLQQSKLAVILGEKSYIQDQSLLNQAVFSQVTALESQGAFSMQIRLQTAAEAQARAYLKVQNAFNEKLKQNAKDIAGGVVAKLPAEAINQINNAKNKDPKIAIQEIYQILQKWDQVLKEINVASKADYKLILYRYIAAELYDYLKDHPSVKEIAHAIEQVLVIEQKVKEVGLICESMEQYTENLKAGWDKMLAAMKGIQGDIESNSQWAVDIENPPTNSDTKKSIQEVSDLILGQGGTGAEKKNVLNSPHPMSQKVRDFFDGAAQTANSVDNLISGTRKVADVIGVQLDPKIEEALNTAQKISDGVKIAEQVATAFSSDGLMGAFSALAGGGGASLMMGPAGMGMAAISQMQMNQEFGKINKKLDEVISLQKQILDLQKQTLARIEDLSQKLDEYHNQEMLAIQSVSNEVLETRRAVLHQIDQHLMDCNALSYRLSSITGAKKFSSLDIMNANDVRENIAAGLANEEVRNSLRAEDETKRSFSACGNAMTDAFAGNEIGHTPLQARLSGNPNEATPFEIDSKLFKPALAAMSKTYPNRGTVTMALHIPTATFGGLPHKDIYLKRNVTSSQTFDTELREMVSVDALERYTGPLLSMHALLSISVGAWNSIPEAIENSWNGKKSWAQKQSRSEFWLRSAMDTVNIAISQQAILAGEPLLSQLDAKMSDILKESLDCTKQESAYCFVRKNSVMAKNLLNYHLFLRSGEASFVAAYTQAYQNKSVPELETLLGSDFAGHISPQFAWVAEGTDVKNPTVAVEFPSPEELQKGLIKYPHEMVRLVKLQERIADELTKVSPNELSEKERKLMTELVLYKGH